MKIAVLGGGIAGLTTAIALKKIGLQPLVYEAAPEIRAVGAGLALAANAIKAFKKLGIDREVMAEGRLLDAFNIKDEKGRLCETPSCVYFLQAHRKNSSKKFLP